MDAHVMLKVRIAISNFAVIIAVFVMSLLDFIVGIPTVKLNVPRTFHPTDPDRGWLVDYLGGNPPWSIALAILPAILIVMLIYMDHLITVVIANRKVVNMKKGIGYHIDLLVCVIMILVCSFLGLPWCVAATVQSLNHVQSLVTYSEFTAPGEAPKMVGCMYVLLLQASSGILVQHLLSLQNMLKSTSICACKKTSGFFYLFFYLTRMFFTKVYS